MLRFCSAINMQHLLMKKRMILSKDVYLSHRTLMDTAAV